MRATKTLLLSMLLLTVTCAMHPAWCDGGAGDAPDLQPVIATIDQQHFNEALKQLLQFYQATFRDDKLDMEKARAVHERVIAELKQNHAPTDYIQYEKRVFLGELRATMSRAKSRDHFSPALHEAAIRLFWSVAAVDPSGAWDITLTMMKDRSRYEAAPVEALQIFARLVQQLPPDDSARPSAYLQLARSAMGVACYQYAAGLPAQQYAGLAEQSYQTLLKDYPAQAASNGTLSALCSLALSERREPEVEKWLQHPENVPLPLDTQEWLANYDYNLGTPEGYSRTQVLLAALLAQAPQHQHAAYWQFRLARALALSGKAAEAITAYQKVIAAYPNWNCAIAAQQAVEQLKEEKP